MIDLSYLDIAGVGGEVTEAEVGGEVARVAHTRGRRKRGRKRHRSCGTTMTLRKTLLSYECLMQRTVVSQPAVTGRRAASATGSSGGIEVGGTRVGRGTDES